MAGCRARHALWKEPPLDPIIVVSVVMLAVWAAGTWFDGPGWIHLLLTGGVLLLIWRIVTRAQRAAESGRADRR